jgi:hypothetical protein
MFCNRNKTIASLHGALQLRYNIQTYMLYHGISPAHLHLDSTKI